MPIEKWLIWSNEHHGWWRPNHNGYTESKEEAGRYTFEEAEHIVRMANRHQVLPGADIPNEAMLPEDLP